MKTIEEIYAIARRYGLSEAHIADAKSAVAANLPSLRSQTAESLTARHLRACLRLRSVKLALDGNPDGAKVEADAEAMGVEMGL